ncbi:hypothetical protein EYF80_036962 [Liparis tanakae]|uniref:Uncharacterized protein n=1 Tax=Liparis tanakae TaxID=230148 RepID=A0A4Z2GJE7_9TELE|nr:hypothetical protein EYF80_036962 [Liparis tanakae]
MTRATGDGLCGSAGSSSLLPPEAPPTPHVLRYAIKSRAVEAASVLSAPRGGRPSGSGDEPNSIKIINLQPSHI